MTGVHVETVVASALLAGAWVGAWRARRLRIAPGRAAFFFGGLLTLLVAVNGPLHELAERSLFSAHMVQHLLLTLVVPPCLLAGTPAWMADAALGRVLGPTPLRRLARTATRPVPALAAHGAALAVWHLPGPYGAALASHGVHLVEHVLLVGTAVLAWWPVLSPSGLLPSLHYGAQVLYLFALGIPMTIVAAMVTGAEAVLYPFYAEAPRVTGLTALEDQRLGGVLMWVPAGVIPLVAFTVVFFRWAAAEADDPGGPADEAPAGGSSFR